MADDMADEINKLCVQVCYATPTQQFLQQLTLPVGATLQDAIVQSGLLEYAKIDLTTQRVGIYGKLKSLDTVLREHDRVEVYRPLIADPKEMRRKRAASKK